MMAGRRSVQKLPHGPKMDFPQVTTSVNPRNVTVTLFPSGGYLLVLWCLGEEKEQHLSPLRIAQYNIPASRESGPTRCWADPANERQ